MGKTQKLIALAALILTCGIFTSCKKETSRTTGWDYNDPEWGGFEVTKNKEQFTGPGLVAIEGGTFTMGTTYDDMLFEWNNIPHRATVSSFYMDITEVANVDYLEYVYWLKRVYTSYPELYDKALPDTLVWRDRMSYNEPLVEIYFRHPAYHDYPVVGVTWLQANDYANWRSDRVNEMLLIRSGKIDMKKEQRDGDNFNMDLYLVGELKDYVREKKPELDADGNPKRVRFEDGIMLPKYRLPTEAEWEYAALGLVGNTMKERVTEGRMYPWNGTGLRTDDKKYYGSFLANFKRGPGDYMGVAGDLNDGASLPGPVGSYWPNDFGLYNMAGNVSEWVVDVYRPLSFEDVADYNPVRGNVFTNKSIDKDTRSVRRDTYGRIIYDTIRSEEVGAERKNYQEGYNINYRDGDFMSSIQSDWLEQPETSEGQTNQVYDYGKTTLISDKARVIKGGSWADGPYFLSPGTRRFLNEDESSSTVGFRCAMNRTGGSVAK
ncbi:MAG: SUMF1/EgtB/PvdO family nonheme iron enzyme [Lentimicrobiaceae bacterium]|jgi:gliding motility-associated lipoprotein GldJ|nr:SUMF1/EgtB/PvdO family nonheme iron enzyme [Lentimicrobiaceae bacterium]